MQKTVVKRKAVASSVGRKNVEVARLLSARAIYASLFLCRAIAKSGGKLEEGFFNYLRNQKLGMVKDAEPRELWALPQIVKSEDE